MNGFRPSLSADFSQRTKASRNRLRRRNKVARVTHILAFAVVCLSLQAQAARAEPALSELARDPNEVLAFGPVRISRWLAETLVKAADITGVEPAYLIALADKESSLRPESRAETSSAEGLFQFVESTWLAVLQRYSAKHGFHAAAEAIERKGGEAAVLDETQRQWVLNLRRDPYLSALMAGEMLNHHREILAGKAQRDPSLTDLYAAHFLGVHDAARLVRLVRSRPGLNATRTFSRAAKANRGVFFKIVKSRSRPLSIGQVRARLAAMMGDRFARYKNVRHQVAGIQYASN